MEKNSILSDFIVLNRQRIDELEADLWQMEHQKSGARLVWLERAEENKTFGIAFQTQPWDDTGVFHILEHSVLCGSKRYPVKEPFVELMKSSLNTFLNAMTFPDRTFYPVSSRNDQDFINLLRVYMDAVLHPQIYDRPEIFGQEGWHYELGEDGGLSCKGVVFNEMKGTFASPDALLEREMTRCLFPDTCYRFVSGGDPEHIPELYVRVKAHMVALAVLQKAVGAVVGNKAELYPALFDVLHELVHAGALDSGEFCFKARYVLFCVHEFFTSILASLFFRPRCQDRLGLLRRCSSKAATEHRANSLNPTCPLSGIEPCKCLGQYRPSPDISAPGRQCTFF